MKKILLAALLTVSGFIVPAYAAAPAIGTYSLQNHPDGAAAPPTYGFRLDELINVTGGHDIFTFDFNHAQSTMQLTWDGSVIHISGQSFGGLDTGGSYGNPLFAGLWAIDFTYNVGVSSAANNLKVVANQQNTGTITRLSDSSVFNLQDQSNGAYSFKFGSEDNGSGHRGFNGISGWGWVNHTPAGSAFGSHVNASDWLFTATPVPEPEIYAMMGLGLGLLGWARRRKAQQA